MSLRFYRGKATGRATCRICNCLIAKGLPEIEAQGYQTSGHIHARKSDCEKAKVLAGISKGNGNNRNTDRYEFLG